jgi:ATP-dependent Clp protease adapter protein ClpS
MTKFNDSISNPKLRPVSKVKLETEVQPDHTAVPVEAPAEEVEHFPGEGYRVTLFNDDFHTVDEVVGQIIKALGCTLDVAVDIMLQAHTRGSAVVIIAEQATADRVAMILREILLVVSVELL